MMNKPKIGTLIPFGEYKWRVLDVQGDRALIITEDIVTQLAYDKNTDWGGEITWEKCTLRNEYLKGEFWLSFTADEQNQIRETPIKNLPNQWHGTNGGSNTNDKIFLLSIEEVIRYFGDSGDLKKRKGWYYKDGKDVLNNTGDKSKDWYINDQYNSDRVANYNNKACWWWLRSPGNCNCGYFAAFVNKYGVVMNDVHIFIHGGGVRPALWLKYPIVSEVC
jgi:hypothetical protein